MTRHRTRSRKRRSTRPRSARTAVRASVWIALRFVVLAARAGIIGNFAWECLREPRADGPSVLGPPHGPDLGPALHAG